MQKFIPVDPKALSNNVFSLLDDEWMLITAGYKDSFNTMTASWGGFGVLWNKTVATIYIRPQRYTYLFAESNAWFTLCFFGREHRKILNYCGKYSGREVDKIKQTGLVPLVTPGGNIVFQQALMYLECRKLYFGDILPDHFLEKDIIQRIYPTRDFHRFYIGEIVHCMKKEN